MNFLFLHNNFPAQFHRLSAALAANPAHHVVFLSCFRRLDMQAAGVQWRQVLASDKAGKASMAGAQPPPLRQGELFGNAMLALRNEGFQPDVVLGHVGFGSALYAPDIFPRALQTGYFEWFYNEGADTAFFGGSEQIDIQKKVIQRHSNMCVLSALEDVTAGFCPTRWQRDQHPQYYHNKLHVVHDGVDTDYFSPSPGQRLILSGVGLTDAEIITYATRGLEPYRGFPTFYRSLPAVLAARPKAHVLIMGDDRTVYGGKRDDGKSWRQALSEEVSLDEDRVHFLPFQPYPKYRALLRASHVHVYLTAPFILSWSLLEAMSCGCLVISSDTPPVQEVVQHGRNGLLVGFWDHENLSCCIIDALKNISCLDHMRRAARETICNDYALSRMLQQQIDILNMYK